MKNKTQFGAMVVATAIIVATAIMTACATTSTQNKSEAGPQPESKEQSGTGIADFTLKNLEGRSVSLSDYLGDHVVVISYWATWCGPCKKEMVQLNELFLKHKDNGLVVLSISMDDPESVGEVRPYIKQRGYTFPVLLDTESLVTNQFNPRANAPYTLIINRAQEIAWTHAGYVPGDEVLLETEILAALNR